MKIVFRASREHLARSLAYMDGLRESEPSAEIALITSGSPKLGIEGVSQTDIGSQSTQSWDLEFTEEALGDGADILLLDNRPDEKAQKALKKKARMLVIVDDEPSCARYHADVIVNPNIHAHTIDYPAPKETETLLGTEFYPLPGPFDAFQDFQRETGERCRKIAIHPGGDESGLAAKALRALKASKMHFLATILLPENFAHGDNIAREIGLDERFIVADRDPRRLMDADLGIASPETIHELIFFRIPSCLYGAQGAPLLSDYASRSGLSLPLPDAGSSLSLIEGLMENAEERKRMSARMTDLVDGLGRFRLAEDILRIHTQKF
ncbi:MAG TPA: hypothetical protein VLD37_07390 [Candidatus Bilamarchaeum sp.]|nr:hypothetical protein [Candidatus Bilamarchaeum sp.]